MIHEVKVFDPSGKLKKVISQKYQNKGRGQKKVLDDIVNISINFTYALFFKTFLNDVLG